MRTLQEMNADAAAWASRGASDARLLLDAEVRRAGDRLADDVAELLRVLRTVFEDHDGTFGGKVRRDGSKPRVCFTCRTLWPCPTARVLLTIPGMPIGSVGAPR